MDYSWKDIEQKWQALWRESEAFKAQLSSNKPKYYVLEMFPYPSGKMHMGHVRNYTIGDVTARFMRSRGHNVLYPMGWDAFGLPAENAAIQHQIHPTKWTYDNIATMRKSMMALGFSYEWDREFASCDADYFAHEQRFFLEMLKEGIAYRKESWVNWDPVDHTVLANEQVQDGKGWRSGAPVERRQLSQWFLRITHYADSLLEGLKTLQQWPEKVRLMQEHWIGKSTGARIRFTLDDRNESIDVYTTRPDTLYGASFIAIAPEHPIAAELAMNNPKISAFIKECQSVGVSESAIEKAEKVALDTGLRALHPFDSEIRLPVLITNFVLMEYGTGAVYGCPAHDERDYAVATRYQLPIRSVVALPDGSEAPLPYTGPGRMIHSDFLDNLSTDEAKAAAIARLESLKKGEGVTNYRLRDWGVSRQRYWGCPIPIIYCQACGVVPVPKEDLPVTLPKDVTFDKPGNPLEHHPTWKHVACPKCGGKAKRETDTFDTFFESSWYFLRFCDPRYSEPLNRTACDTFMPVDQYIGGVEHAVLHLLYARFFTRVLKQLGYISVEEPFKSLLTQGMINHVTYKDSQGKWVYPSDVIARDGVYSHAKTGEVVTIGRVEKMSKSKHNVVEPSESIERYGADSVRLFIMSDSPPDRDLEWSDSALHGVHKFLTRVMRVVSEWAPALRTAGTAEPSAALQKLRIKAHQTLDAVTRDITMHHFNRAVARIRELANDLMAYDGESHRQLAEVIDILLVLLSPFTPHMSEELWQKCGHTTMLAHMTSWPVADPTALETTEATIAVQVNGKLRGTLTVSCSLSEEERYQLALALAPVQRAIEGNPIKKVIGVKDKIINIVL